MRESREKKEKKEMKGGDEDGTTEKRKSMKREGGPWVVQCGRRYLGETKTCYVPSCCVVFVVFVLFVVCCLLVLKTRESKGRLNRAIMFPLSPALCLARGHGKKGSNKIYPY